MLGEKVLQALAGGAQDGTPSQSLSPLLPQAAARPWAGGGVPVDTSWVVSVAAAMSSPSHSLLTAIQLPRSLGMGPVSPPPQSAPLKQVSPCLDQLAVTVALALPLACTIPLAPATTWRAGP